MDEHVLEHSTTASQFTPAKGMSTQKFWITATVLALVAASFEIQQLMVIPIMGLLGSTLNISAATTTWIILAALVTGAVVTGPLCRLSDRIGPKKVYLAAAAATLIGNCLCALAVTYQIPILMMIGRGLVGINIAAAMGIAILKTLGSTKQMQVGLGLVTLGNGVGVVPSFLLAGFLIDRGVDLASVFWIAGILASSCVLLLLAIPQTVGSHHVRIPLLSSALVGAWVLPICLFLSFGNSIGWTSLRSLGLLVVAVGAFTTWIRIELKSSNPLLPIRMLRGNALVGYYATACVGLLAYGYYVMASAFVQISPEEAGFGFGLSVFQSGLVLLPAGILVTTLGPLVGRVMNRWGAKRMLVAGSTILFAQFVLMIFFKSELWQMYAYAGIFGVGVAMFLPAGWSVFAMQASKDEIGITAGMALILQMIYGSLTAALIAVTTTREFVPGTMVSIESGYSYAFAFFAVAMAVAVLLALRIRTDRDGYVSEVDGVARTTQEATA